ncbi:MAG TPA: phytase, partial [Phycisphaerae bacterium]|nr:phytase [Phycisphaerae bacterium]
DRNRDAFHVFISDNDSNGSIRQFELFDNGGSIGGQLVRAWNVGSLTEGLVVDDAHRALFVGEEDVGVWRYDADPAAPTGPADRLAIGRAAGEVKAHDVEGLALLHVGDPRGEGGYLLVSEQGNDSFAILERFDHDGDGNRYEYLDRFSIVSGSGIDGTSDTDGIEAVSTALGATFPDGLFIAQDGLNDPSGQNYKLVSWADIVAAAPFGPAADPGFDPRRADPATLAWTGAAGTTWDVAETANWSQGGSPRTFWQGDHVVLDDTVAAAPLIEIADTVIPASVLVDSDTVNFEFTGAGSIAGSCGLTKNGDGTLTIATVNTYTGETRINAGAVIATAEGAFGAGVVTLGDAELYFLADQYLDTLTIGEGGKVVVAGAYTIVLKHLVMDGVDLGAATLTPEPATLALLALGGLALLSRRSHACTPPADPQREGSP